MYPHNVGRYVVRCVSLYIGISGASSEHAAENKQETAFFLSTRKICPVSNEGQYFKSETDVWMKTCLQILSINHRPAYSEFLCAILNDADGGYHLPRWSIYLM